MSKRPALGKSISNLLAPEDDVLAGITRRDGALIQVGIGSLDPNPYQPRYEMNEDALAELADSIAQNGVLQPVLVRRAPETDDRYQLIAGHRRYEAAKRVGLDTLPAVVRDADDSTLLQIALIENLQRENLTPLEEAQAYHSLIEQFGYRHEDVAERVGKSRAHISNMLRLLNLPMAVQSALNEGGIQAGHARALLSLSEQERIHDALHQVTRRGLSVRATEQLVRQMLRDAEQPRGTRKSSQPPERDPNLEALESALQRALGTRVSIKQQGQNKGYIKIDFYNLDDIDRICAKIGVSPS